MSKDLQDHEKDEFMRLAMSGDAGMQELLKLWVASMSGAQRERMDERIISRFESDTPMDTALILLRDLLNSHAFPIKLGVKVQGDHLERAELITGFPLDDGSMIDWMHATNAILNKTAYRICNHCGTPFAYKSKRAAYCSDVCRTAASRARKQA